MTIWILFGYLSEYNFIKTVTTIPTPVVYRTYQECFKSREENTARLLKLPGIKEVDLQCQPVELKKKRNK